MATEILVARSCTKCGVLKDAGEFARDRRARFRLRSACKRCDAARHTRWHAENADAVRERHAKWRAANPEYFAEWRAANRERERERAAHYYAANADAVRERHARYYAENAEAVRERRARYDRENPEVARAKERKRRARKALVPHIPYDGESLLSAPCFLCGGPAEAVEHFYPLARWWDPRTADAAYNCLSVCTSCNSRKRDREPLAHWESLGFRPFDRVVFADPREWADDPDYAEVYTVAA